MTVIAWDGRTLAGDKRITSGSHINTVTKIFKIESKLFGFAGELTQGLAVKSWLSSGMDKDKFPDVSDDFEAIVIHDGKVYSILDKPVIILWEDPFYAIGSGAPYAIAAMHCGKTAREAVLIACKYDAYCGNGINILKL